MPTSVNVFVPQTSSPIPRPRRSPAIPSWWAWWPTRSYKATIQSPCGTPRSIFVFQTVVDAKYANYSVVAGHQTSDSDMVTPSLFSHQPADTDIQPFPGVKDPLAYHCHDCMINGLLSQHFACVHLCITAPLAWRKNEVT